MEDEDDDDKAAEDVGPAMLKDAEITEADLATPREVRAFWTATMRNDPKVHKRRVSYAKRLKASELLAKSHGMFSDKLTVDGQGIFDIGLVLKELRANREEGGLVEDAGEVEEGA